MNKTPSGIGPATGDDIPRSSGWTERRLSDPAFHGHLIVGRSLRTANSFALKTRVPMTDFHATTWDPSVASKSDTTGAAA
jgi:hypothetical protein